MKSGVPDCCLVVAFGTTSLCNGFLSVALALSLSVGSALADDKVANKKERANYEATSRYYASLISPTTPRLAELVLFTTMLPKGGDLHHHYSGAIYVEKFLDWVEAQNYCIYRENDVKHPAQKYRIETKPAALPDDERSKCIGVDAVKNDNAFYRELLEHWSDKDYANHSHEQLPPDEQFFNTFGFFGPVSGYSYRDGLQSLKARAIAENVGYIETMLKGAPVIDNAELAPHINALTSGSSDQDIDAALKAYFDFLQGDASAQAAVGDYVKAVESAGAGLDDAQFKLRFQAYVFRGSEPAKVFSSLYSSFAAASRSKLIVGVNIVGPENGVVAMRDYTLHMKMFRFLKQRFPGVKTSLHAGELALGMVPPEGLQNHIAEAVEIAGAARIGHGVDIAHENNAYELLKTMRRRQIAVEINLTSNAFILGVSGDEHPVLLYRQFKVPFVISTDDAGVSRNNLSGEYVLFASRYKPSYRELKKVVYDSIAFSFLSVDDKRDEMKKLDKRYAVFEERIAAIARSH